MKKEAAIGAFTLKTTGKYPNVASTEEVVSVKYDNNIYKLNRVMFQRWSDFIKFKCGVNQSTRNRYILKFNDINGTIYTFDGRYLETVLMKMTRFNKHTEDIFVDGDLKPKVVLQTELKLASTVAIDKERI